ncbi:MAG: D-aminoacyl-tRNA deacylase [Bacteroidetes bacterium]|nr:D-aminoacyl-tRNA deacylase [Bacteroidota bacterium]MDA0888817.1 D-aminoacyl-tRNA deacylase [Bacteroidota bacterium]MDA1084580.1 D-aminoacyl-tRNA deacylase [Bacteroidota bacterium]
MRAVLQRVSEAQVTANRTHVQRIGNGLVVLLGITHTDLAEDVDWLIQKIVNMRIFNDENGVMNKSVLEIGGELLVVSQFTLFAQTKKGNRPSYSEAAKHDIAVPLYDMFLEKATLTMGKPVQCGIFGADMQIDLVNDGPVTIIMDSKNRDL